MKPVLLKIPKELHKKLKLYCVQKEQTIQSTVTKLIKELLR